MERLTIHRSPAPPRGFADSGKLYLRPVGLLRGDTAVRATDSGNALSLAGASIVFSALEIVVRATDRVEASWLPVGEIESWRHVLSDAEAEMVDALIARLTGPRSPFAGMIMDHPRIMGVVNVTPDSFSDGGQLADADQAIDHGIRLAQSGADFVDVGGESTRPGADPISVEEEQARVLPVVRGLVDAGFTVSIDTRNPNTMTRAAEAGARVINDVTALTHADDSLTTTASTGLPVVLMHSAGDPRVMQDDPAYDHAALDVYDVLEQRVADCIEAGIPRDRIAIDPGFGFGKTVQHNLRLVSWLSMFHGLGCPVLIGASRKSTIGRVAGLDMGDTACRLPGSLALAQAAWDQGVQIVRVHDVAETAQALSLWRALGNP